MPTIIENAIDNLVSRLKSKGLYTATVSLYAEGIKGKFLLARYCIDFLTILEHSDSPILQVDSNQQILPQTINDEYQVMFYCESFWNLLRSSIDILLQLINELSELGINERQVDFNKIKNKIKLKASNHPLEKALQSLENSKAFKNLNEYRHCCTHRRQIFIKKDIQQITHSYSGTPGYNYTDFATQTTVVNRYLCSNPWDLNPVVDENRPVAAFNGALLRQIESRLITIIKQLP